MTKENANNAPAAGEEGAENNGADTHKAGTGGEGGGKNEAGAPQLYKPKGLDEQFLGKSDQETIDKLQKAYTGARTELSKKGKDVPAKPDDYKIELPEEALNLLVKPGEDGKDAVFEAVKKVAHENGVTNKGLTAVMATVAEAIKGMQGEGGEGESTADFDFKELGGLEKAKPLQDSAIGRAMGLKAQGKLTDQQVEEVKLAVQYGEGLSLVSALLDAAGEIEIPADIGSSSGNGEITLEQLRARVADPKYHKEQDPEFIAETTKMFQQFYGKKDAA